MKRKRYSQSERESFLKFYNTSSDNIALFCQKYSISIHTMKNWLKRSKDQITKPEISRKFGMAEVYVDRDQKHKPLQIELPNHLKVNMTCESSQEFVSIIRSLAQC